MGGLLFWSPLPQVIDSSLKITAVSTSPTFAQALWRLPLSVDLKDEDAWTSVGSLLLQVPDLSLNLGIFFNSRQVL